MLFYELKDILEYKAVCQLSGKRCENQWWHYDNSKTYVILWTQGYIKNKLFVNFQVKDVRINDDTMITLKLMLFYELKDILKYKAVCQLSGKRCENQWWHYDNSKTYVILWTKGYIKIIYIKLFVDFQVKDVRTNDDTMITVKLMLFYELKDILKMVSCYCLWNFWFG